MSIESIPDAYKEPFDPFSAVDHALVATYTKARLMRGESVRAELQRAYNFNRYISPALIGRLMNYGKFLEPVDDNLDVIDDEFGRVRAFYSGTALALVATANLAFELEVDQLEWRERWVGLPEGIEAPSSIKVHNDMSADDCFRIGSALMETGHRNLRQFETPYQELIEELNATRQIDGSLVNTLQASFGYTLGIGRRVVRDIVYERTIEEVIDSVMPDATSPGVPDALDEEYEALVRAEMS